MDNIIFKKYTRYFDGGYTLNFYNALSGVNDYKFKNYTNFFLTRNTKINDIIESDFDVLKSDSIMTNLNFGGNYLIYKEPNQKQLGLSGIYTEYDYYGNYGFSSNNQSLSANFVIEFKDDNICNIYYYNNYKKYYLYRNSDNILNFYTENLGLTAKDFRYIYSRNNKAISLFQNISNKPYFLKNTKNILTLSEMTSANKILVYNNPIYLSRDIYTNFEVNNNTTFVEYDTDNTISNDGIIKDLKNNFLLHRENNSTDIIVLKNQLTQEDTFTSGNNLLSSQTIKYFSDNMRNYTSIFSDINSEKDESLNLNYVFYNKSYKIIPGKNTFIAPDNMSPFSQININDTKFVNCGAFAYPTPEYADKVYRLDTTINYTDGQTYLCTWLSGSPLSNEKVWVDRYYYPDFIDKSDALINKNTFNITYENTIEQLVKNNTLNQASISSFSIFDKKSDMVFLPGKKYIYERIQSVGLIENTIEITPCQNLNLLNNSINYFKQINDIGKFTVLFYFNGDMNNWTLKSKRNNKNGGLKIEKNSENIIFEMNLYDPSLDEILSFRKKSSFKPLQKNFICCSINVITGEGYFFLNNQIIDFFNFGKNRFYTKKILFGDFFVDNDDIFKIPQSKIQNFQLLNSYSEPELAFILPILNGVTEINNIYITLPCGMRNSSDNIELLQSACNNQTYKSNAANIYLKNININDDVKKKVENKIIKNIERFVPITTELNTINFIE